MENNPIDLKAYALGEATPTEQQVAAAHLAESAEARDEFESLQLTLTALASVRDEEMPRRIAFVSDPVFEPSLWQRIWGSGARLAFGGATLLAVAITAHGFLTRPVVTQVGAPVAGISQADIDRTVDKAVTSAVTAAVIAVDARTEARVKDEVSLALVKAEKRYEGERQMMAVSFEENLNILRKQMNRMYVTNAGLSIGPKE